MNEGLDIVVTLGHRCEILLHEIFLSVCGITNEMGREWVAHFIDTEVDRAAADTCLHTLKHQCLHDDVDCGEDVGKETEVPVGIGVAEVVSVEDKHG